MILCAQVDMSEYQVNAVQACGGQMTADGRRFRTGGGILWSIIKTREPNAYKEIMKRAKEFEVFNKTLVTYFITRKTFTCFFLYSY